MKRSARGFTLIELMMTLALAAVILGLGVPAFRDFARNGRLTGGANELLVTIVAARNAAMRSNINTSVCPSASPDSAGASCSAGANEGWIAFMDADGDCQRDAGEEKIAQMVIHSQVNPPSNASCLQFRRTGFRQPIAGQPATARVMFCDVRGNTAMPDGSGNSYARGLEVLPTGRAYVSRQFAELSSWAGSADPVSCP
jgi:type IV fimbrial biogenesis protein FimT